MIEPGFNPGAIKLFCGSRAQTVEWAGEGGLLTLRQMVTFGCHLVAD